MKVAILSTLALGRAVLGADLAGYSPTTDISVLSQVKRNAAATAADDAVMVVASSPLMLYGVERGCDAWVRMERGKQ